MRRKFVDAKKAQPKGKAGLADSAIAKIAKLYALEKRHKQSDSTARQIAREQESKS